MSGAGRCGCCIRPPAGVYRHDPSGSDSAAAGHRSACNGARSRARQFSTLAAVVASLLGAGTLHRPPGHGVGLTLRLAEFFAHTYRLHRLVLHPRRFQMVVFQLGRSHSDKIGADRHIRRGRNWLRG